MVRWQKKLLFLVISLIIGAIYSQYSNQLSTSPKKNIHAKVTPTSTNVLPVYTQVAQVAKVIDGDTIQIDTGQKVRYIGIDTPELHKPATPVQCFAKEAYEMNKQLVEGKKVRLVKDVSETDRYGRLLRYVYLIDENTIGSNPGGWVNEYLVKEGYAHAATFPPDVKYADHFVQLETEARNNQKGLWSACR